MTRLFAILVTAATLSCNAAVAQTAAPAQQPVQLPPVQALDAPASPAQTVTMSRQDIEKLIKERVDAEVSRSLTDRQVQPDKRIEPAPAVPPVASGDDIDKRVAAALKLRLAEMEQRPSRPVRYEEEGDTPRGPRHEPRGKAYCPKLGSEAFYSDNPKPNRPGCKMVERVPGKPCGGWWCPSVQR